MIYIQLSRVSPCAIPQPFVPMSQTSGVKEQFNEIEPCMGNNSYLLSKQQKVQLWVYSWILHKVNVERKMSGKCAKVTTYYSLKIKITHKTIVRNR